MCKTRNTSLTCVSWLTGTVVIIDEVNAGGPMLALADTVVDVLVPILAHPPDPTLAVVIAHQVRARYGVYAGIGQTFVCIWGTTRK